MKRRISSGREDQPIQRAADAEVSDELAFHLEQRVEEYIARGMTPKAAREAATQRFGDVNGVQVQCTTLLEEERRMTDRRAWFSDLQQDLRLAGRSALRAPLLSLLTILVLALGIGVNTAIFSGVKAVLLDALPFPESGRLAMIYGRLTDGTLARGSLSPAGAHDIAGRAREFESVGWFVRFPQDVALGEEAGPQVIRASYVGPTLFRTLGVRAHLGRTIEEADMEGPGAVSAVLHYAAWQRVFGGDPAVIGRDVRLNGQPHTIVGVMPRGFVGPMGAADVWVTINIRGALQDPVRSRQSHWLGMVGRLTPASTVDGANRELMALGAALAREHPGSQAGITYGAESLRDVMVGDIRTPLLVLMVSAGVVLLIACSNLAGVLLSRALSRRREFAIRLALGAGRGRLVRQMLAESISLAMVGGLIGLGMATIALGVVEGLARQALPAHVTLSLDVGPLAFAACMALLTGAVLGIVPALAVSRGMPIGTLREEGRGSSETRGTGRARGVLVAAQIALCLSLVAGAGLLTRSLWSMTSAPAGFDAGHALTFGVQLLTRNYGTPALRIQFFEQFEEKLRGIPGVAMVASAGELPSPTMNRNGLTIEGSPWPAGTGVPFINFTGVSDEYFRAMGITLRSGRTFDVTDRDRGEPGLVISERMAALYWPGGDAIGKRVKMGPPDSPWLQVIGIVGDVRNDPGALIPAPMAYGSSRQDPDRSRTFVVRTSAGIVPLSLVRQVQRELAALDPELPIYDATTLEEFVARSTVGRRLPVVLMLAFGALALLLASVGVYAMFASLAAARERECGVRLALGASRASIAGLVLRSGARWMLLGVAAGALGVVLVGRGMRDLLFGIPMFDPVTLVSTTLILVVCSALALLLPVRRVTRVDPVAVLR